MDPQGGRGTPSQEAPLQAPLQAAHGPRGGGAPSSSDPPTDRTTAPETPPPGCSRPEPPSPSPGAAAPARPSSLRRIPAPLTPRRGIVRPPTLRPPAGPHRPGLRAVYWQQLLVWPARGAQRPRRGGGGGAGSPGGGTSQPPSIPLWIGVGCREAFPSPGFIRRPSSPFAVRPVAPSVRAVAANGTGGKGGAPLPPGARGGSGLFGRPPTGEPSDSVTEGRRGPPPPPKGANPSKD